MFKKLFLTLFCLTFALWAYAADFHDDIFPVKELKPIDSELKVKVGDKAPDFSLPSTHDTIISLSDYKGEKNIMISFIPAAWTPVCSDQWPGYNLAEGLFRQLDTVVIGISVDNVPTLYAWTKQMGGFWYPVVSDFWPHGAVAEEYGVLRTDGPAERAIIIVDKEGIIRFAHVEDINRRPELEMLINALKEIQ
jgi:peroxiredoxin (alkyl hydroperoxide reductase subunit C)